MVQKLRASKKGTALLALLIAVLTVVYLLVTSALAQPENGTAVDSKISYTRDVLSYGDVWAFDYDNVDSPYNKPEKETQKYYTGEIVTENPTSKTVEFYRYYINPTTSSTSRTSGIVGDHIRTAMGAETFISSNVQTSSIAGVNGMSIPVKTGIGTANRYTVVPESSGDYYVYAYSENGEPVVQCAVLDTAAGYNSFVGYNNSALGTGLASIAWDRVDNSNWYIGKVTTTNTHWSAWSVKNNQTTSSNQNDTELSGKKSNDSANRLTGLNNNYYVNDWQATEVWFDTLLVFEFDSSTKLGPITKQDTITIHNDNKTNATCTGTLTVQNIFGQSIKTAEAAGDKIQTVHAPLLINTTAGEGAEFYGFLNENNETVTPEQLDKNTYAYKFEATATLQGTWEKLVRLPTITVTRTDATGVIDTTFGEKVINFKALREVTEKTITGQEYTYNIHINWGGADTDNIAYQYQLNDAEPKTFTSSLTDLSIPVKWDTQTVTFTAKGQDVDINAVITAEVEKSVEDKLTTPAGCVATIGATHYYWLEDALADAKAGETIILKADATFFNGEGSNPAWGSFVADANGNVGPGYTVKSGVTLVVPFDKDGTAITKPDDTNLYSEKQHSAVKEGFKAYRTFTLASGQTLSVQGTLVVGGRWASASGGSNASIIPPYGLIQMEENSRISVENGGKLYAWGYISGSISDDRTQVDGDITVKNGGTVYEIFQIQDFRGGTQSSSITNWGKGGVFPFSQYYIQNIEAPLTLYAGAKEITSTALWAKAPATAKINATFFTMIGDKDDGLFRLTSDDASLKRTYDPSRDRMTYALSGATEINSIQMGMAGQTVDSSIFYLPINSSMSVKVESGTTTIASNIALLPGVEVTIDKNATLAVAENKTLFAYDADEWVNKGYVGADGKQDMIAVPYSVANGTTAVRKNESLVDAAVTVNGTLKADGNVCTSASGANITCGEKGRLEIGANGIQTSTIQQAKKDTKIDTPHTAAQLKNADGSYSQTAGVKNATLTKGDEDTFIKTSTDGKQEQETVKLQVGTDPAKRYFTYAAAISSLGQSKSATLTALSESTETVSIDAGKTITIDVNGKKIGAIQNLSNMTIIGKGSIQSIQNTGAGSVTIPKESTVQVAGAINDGVIFSIAAGSFSGRIENKDDSKLVISDGTFAAELNNQMGGTATISGGTFKGLNNRGTITLSGGKFDEVKNQGTITVTAPADVKIKSLPIPGTLEDSTGTPLTLEKTADAEGYYSLTENTATIRFNCNGTKDGKTIATGVTDEKKVRLVGSTAYDYPFKMTAENYSFKGWAMSADATEALFEADKTMKATLDAQTLKENGATVGGTLDLYAVYQKEWSYKIIWNVDGKKVQETHWTDSMKEALYTLAADVTNAITEVKVTGPEESYTMTRRNRSVTLADVKADLIVDITTGKEEGNATYYMGEMSFQYYKNMAVFTNDGWKMLDNYTWRHKTGSVTHEDGENTYTVANGDILLVNNSNRVYVYTIELTKKELDWAHMEFLASGGTVTQSDPDKIVVIVQPSAEVTVTGKMKGQTNDFSLTNASLGSISVSAVLEN